MLQVEVIAPVLTNYFHCMHCEQIFAQAGLGRRVHQEERDQYPPEFRADSERLADLLLELVDRYGDQIRIRVIDPQSLEGFWRSLRHWIRTYPTFIVNGRWKVQGWDRDELQRVLERSREVVGP